MGRKKDDAVLRIFNEVLCLDRLHYGLWLPEDEISFESLRTAQKRYEDLLVETIPDGVKRILDVGCGTGVMADRLKDLSYDVEALSPDVNQKGILERERDIHFHFCCFEDFVAEDPYDCIIMSESSQYIRLHLLFEVVARSLRENGYLLVCDYFVLDDLEGALSKSGHAFRTFMEEAKSHGFRVDVEKDITEDVVKTLDMARLYAERCIRAVEIYVEKLRKSHPCLVGIVLWILGNRIEKWKGQLDLVNSERFKESKVYKLLLFRHQT